MVGGDRGGGIGTGGGLGTGTTAPPGSIADRGGNVISIPQNPTDPGSSGGSWPYRRLPMPGIAADNVEIANRFTLPDSNNWFPISVSRPTVLVPRTTVPNGQFLYHPSKNPTAADADSYRSTSFGVCYLFAPGTWYVKCDFAISAPFQFLVLDASDASIAWRYMTDPGAAAPTHSRVAVTDTASTVLSANTKRQWLMLQNNSDIATGEDICIAMNAVAVFPVAAVGRGLVLKKGGGAGGTIVFAGAFMMKHFISAIHATPAVTQYLDIAECV